MATNAGQVGEMDPRDQHRFVAGLLLASEDQIAMRAATRLVQGSPTIAERYAPQPTLLWADHLREQLRELVAGLQLATEKVFSERVVWTRDSFAARGVPEDDLAAALVVLAHTVERELPEADRPLIQRFFKAALGSLGRAPVEEACHLDSRQTWGRLGAEYLVTVLQGDRRRAVTLVTDAVRAGRISARDAYLRVLTGAQREIGRLWHAGELTVPEEHSATATTHLALSLLAELMPRSPSNGKVVVCACIERNAHDLGLRMVTDFFEAAGWRAVYLGSNMPREDIAQAAATFEADLLAMSAMLRSQIEPLREAIAGVRSDPTLGHVKVLVGGGAFEGMPNLWREIGADGLAADAEDAVRVGNRLVGLPEPARV